MIEDTKVAEAAENTFVLMLFFGCGVLCGLVMRPESVLFSSPLAGFFGGFLSAAAIAIPAIWLALGRPAPRDVWYGEDGGGS